MDNGGITVSGKKGMKHARPRTREEKDIYALARIEELLDGVIEGSPVQSWDQIRMRALEIRYNKLRASLASTELTDKREGYADVLKRMSQGKQEVTQPQPVAQP